MKRFFQIFIIVLFVLFIGSGALLQTKSVRNRAKEYISNVIERETGYRVEIEDIHLFPSFQMTAKTIRLYDGEALMLTCDHLHFGLYPYELWKGKVHLSRFHIEALNILQTPESKREEATIQMPLIPIKIDEIMIDDLIVKNSETPIHMRGSLRMDPSRSNAYLDFQIQSFDNHDKWYSGDLLYEEGQGSVRVELKNEFELKAEYVLTPQKLCRIPRFHASYGPVSLDGNIAFNFDGKITESEFFLSTDDLSEISPIGGHFSGQGRLIGDIWAPEISLSLSSDQVDVKGIRIENVEAHLVSSKARKGVTGKIDLTFTRNGDPFHFTGNLGWQIVEKEPILDFSLEIDLIEIIQLLALDLTDISGRIEINATLSSAGLNFVGEVTNGLIESYQYGAQFNQIHASIKGDFDQIQLTQFSAQDNTGGTYLGKGTVILDLEKQLPFSLTLNLDQASILQLETIKTTARGTLTFEGDMNGGELSGELTTQSVNMILGGKGSSPPQSVEITYINQQEAEIAPTQIKPEMELWPITLNLKVMIPNHAKVKGSDFSSIWGGEFTITGTPMKPLYHGQFKLQEGRYKVRGRSLELTQGSVTLSGDLKKNTTLYIVAAMDIDRYTIEAVIKGSVRHPSIILRSSPPMSQRQILSLILFNKDISEISDLQGEQLNHSLVSLSSQVDEGPDLLTRIGNTLGVDRIDIGKRKGAGEDQFSVEVGKYIGEKTYISISRHMSDDSSRPTQTNQVAIETDLGRNFKLRAEVDEDTRGQINLLWRKDY